MRSLGHWVLRAYVARLTHFIQTLIQGLTIGGVYTFGSPRVGDDRFRIMYEQTGLADVTWRFVHRNDAIPQVGV